MSNLQDLQNAGTSRTGRAWLTNPVRRLLLVAARPYFAWMLTEIEHAKLSGLQQVESGRQASDAQRHEIDQMVSTFREETCGVAQRDDALRKDQMAVNFRLGGLEDQIHEEQQSSKAERAALHCRLQALELAMSKDNSPSRSDGNFNTLRSNKAMAISGTSLVVSDGPYGRFILRQPDLISDHILNGGFWDAHLKTVIERFGATNRSALDAGAYLGFHSCYMARYFRTVYAFEPQVEIYRMLCSNLLLNNCHNVVAVNGALYEMPGHMRLADSVEQEIPVPTLNGGLDYDHVGNAAAMAFQVSDASNPTAVAAQTVDQLGLADLGFMKVDTQGSDLRVLRGSRQTIERCKPIIVAEYERELAKHHGSTWEGFHAFFREIGYNVQVLREQDEGKQIDLLATPA